MNKPRSGKTWDYHVLSNVDDVGMEKEKWIMVGKNEYFGQVME